MTSDISDAHNLLERLLQECPDAHELTYGAIQLSDGSRLIALPDTLEEGVVIALADALPDPS